MRVETYMTYRIITSRFWPTAVSSIEELLEMCAESCPSEPLPQFVYRSDGIYERGGDDELLVAEVVR